MRILTQTLLLTAIAFTTRATDIWTGPSLTYSQPAAVPTVPANQDRLTGDIWLTRGPTQGLFNAYDESSYAHFSSPIETEWAYGSLANYASLTYQSWENFNGGSPPSMIGRDAVLHLVPDDVYLSIHFTSWGGSGGGFSYIRSTPSIAPEPSASLLVVIGLATLSFLRRTLVSGK